MRKAAILTLTLVFSFVLFPLSKCFAQVEQERIDLFEVNLTLDKNTDIRINEKIHYYFPVPKHGIYRFIPVNKRDKGNSLKTPTTIKLNSVRYYPSDNMSNIYKEYDREDEILKNVTLKIGEKDRLIKGEYVYEINYVVKNGINYFEDHDELYWNIIGTGWVVPIQRVEATINLPGEVRKAVCYTGSYKSTEENCTIHNKANNELSLSSNNILNPNEAMTIAVEMPKGSIDDIREKERKRIRSLNTLGLSSILLVPLLYMGIFRKWNLRSKKLTVVPTYTSPENINPLIAGYLLSPLKMNPKNFTAEIIDLAVKGYLEIEQIKKREYVIRKTETKEVISLDSSNELYSSLPSEINTKHKDTTFGSKLGSIWNKTKDDVEKYNYLDKKKLKATVGLGTLGVVLSLGFFLAAPILHIWGVLLAGTGALVTGLSIIIMSLFTDGRTEEGNKLYYDLLGLKMYINTAEKNRIEFHNDPEKFRGVFETLLPYAIIFGLEKKWIKEFEDIYTTPPDWYKGSDISSFNTYYIMNSISGISSNVKNSGYSSGEGFSGGSSGFGGGFSGGGGGGGGGGSW